MNIEDAIIKGFGYAIIVLIVGIGAIGVWSFFKYVQAKDGAVDHCYVEYYNQSTVTPPTYVVKGFVPWRSNIIVGIAPSQDGAEKLMHDSAVCPK